MGEKAKLTKIFLITAAVFITIFMLVQTYAAGERYFRHSWSKRGRSNI